MLNGLGIYKFAQIAGWKKAERDWVDGYLNFKGRIERDDWVSRPRRSPRAVKPNILRCLAKNRVSAIKRMTECPGEDFGIVRVRR